MMIDIVTATYNRKNLLPRLYLSLIKQSSKSFNWIIVDDGSIDETRILVEEYIAENKINIIYIYKENGGKHTALNLAIQHCSSNYVFFVDSDDVLPVNSLKTVIKQIQKIEKREDYNSIAGVCGVKSDLKLEVVGNRLEGEVVCSYLDYRYKYKIVGDKAEIFKTSVLKKYTFPVFQGEKFCPEGLIWNRVSKEYNMFFFDEIIYNCEYQNDGLTSNSVILRKNSPSATLLYYSELSQSNINIFYRLKALLNFWRFYYLSNFKNVNEYFEKPTGFLSFVSRPVMFLITRFKFH